MIVNAFAFRVGCGFDAHRFAEGRPLVLGGVVVPFERGLEGHSDADVLVHSLCDAILGAVGEGDLGRHFPDTDPRYKGISSLDLLRRTVALARERGGWTVVNADLTLVLQAPKIAPYVGEMKERIGAILGPDAAVNIKATTTEGLGFAGRGEGAAAMAVVLMAEAGPSKPPQER